MDNYHEKLTGIVPYAYNHTAFYKTTYDRLGIDPNNQDIQQYFKTLPIVSKSDVLAYSEQFLSDEYEKVDLYHDRTSGSTGKILDVYWDKKQNIRSIMSLWSKRRQRFGIQPDSKSVYFHSIHYRNAGGTDDEGQPVSNVTKHVFSPRVMLIENGTILSFSKLDFSEKALNTYYDYMVKFQPEWIMGHPSTLLLFARHIQKYQLPTIKTLKYIELTGEFLPPQYKEIITEIMQAPAANEYGAREVNGVAYECEYGHLHCLPQNVYVEIIKDGRQAEIGESGRICVTGLNNRAMPFIRYDLGDLGRLLPGENCPCGNRNPILEVQAGRGNELIELPNGCQVECVIMFYAVEAVNAEQDNCILQFKAVQHKKDCFELVVVVPPEKQTGDWQEAIKKSFINALLPYGFKGTNWAFTFAKEIIPQAESEKYNFFASKIDK